MDLARFRYYTRWHATANERRYGAPADPWRLVYVDPNDVDYYLITDERTLPLNWGLGRVRGGDWDADGGSGRIDELSTYRGLAQHFEDGRAWADTAYVDWARERIAEDGSLMGYEDVSSFVDGRCAYLDDVYESIRTEGYRPNRDASHDAPQRSAYAHELEPLVAIGRDGTIYLCEGYHRFVLAKLHDLDEIPVNVLCRHERWQRTRDAVADATDATLTGSSTATDEPMDVAQYANHPDVADVLERAE